MKLIKLSPRGYCKGVVSAINAAVSSRSDYPDEKIYILGMIVHNRYVSLALKNLGIITLDSKGKSRLELLDSIDSGVVIFTAHGVDEQVKNYALKKGLITVDASCVDVLKTQFNVKNKLASGRVVLYIGKKNHPEALAVVSNYENIYLIESIADLELLPSTITAPYITNQTTMSTMEIQDIFDALLKRYPDAQIDAEICSATSTRQNAIRNSQPVDLLYVVGDPLSNNTNKLKEIALASNYKKVLLIETALDVKIEDFENVESIAVTAGASTPTYLTNQVIDVIEYYIKEKSLPEVVINIDQIL